MIPGNLSDRDVTVFPLDHYTTYTAMVEAVLTTGVNKEFIIPNIMAGMEINMAAFQSSVSVLPPSVMFSLLVGISVAILILVISVVVFLMSQTW